MSAFREHLEAATVVIENLFEPPLRLKEVFDAVEEIGDVVLEFKPEGTEEEYAALLREAVDWADDKFAVFQKLDDAVKVGPMLEPFDQTLIKQAVYHIAVPQLARLLANV